MLCTSGSLFRVKKSFMLWRILDGSAEKERDYTDLQENDFLVVLGVLKSEVEPGDYVLHVLSIYGMGYVYSYRFKDIEKILDV